MISSFAEIGKIPELRKRIFFTLAMLAVYRMGVYVFTPGVDVEAMRKMFDTGDGTLFGLINLFSGGAFENFSIFTLGIAPYISVSIIVQVLTPSLPSLQALRKEGERGQRILTGYTRKGTIALALFQGFMIARGLESQGLAVSPGWMFRISTMTTLTAGTAFIMWLGEQITERGIGNGSSIIIFSGIVARMPQVLVSTFELARTGEIEPFKVLILLVFAVLSVAGIVYVERAQRRVPVQYPRRMVGKFVAQSRANYMPLKVNMAGVIPPIFASALIVIPASIMGFTHMDDTGDFVAQLRPGHLLYTVVYVSLIIIFSYFYTAVIFNPEERAEELKKGGGFIPTVRPGKPTAEYLYGVLNRLTLWGALYIALICIVPQWVYLEMNATAFSYVFGGTAVLIAVGVTLDTASQIESHIVSRNYETFMNANSKAQGGVGSVGHMRSRVLKR